MTSPNSWFSLANSPKHIQLTMIQNREKQQILTLEELEPVNVGYYCLIKDLSNKSRGILVAERRRRQPWSTIFLCRGPLFRAISHLSPLIFCHLSNVCSQVKTQNAPEKTIHFYQSTFHFDYFKANFNLV